MTLFSNRTQDLQQHLRCAKVTANELYRIDSVINEFAFQDVNPVDSGERLVQTTNQALMRFVTSQTPQSASRDDSRGIMDLLKGIGRAAALVKEGAYTLCQPQSEMQMHPSIPSPYFMAFQIERALHAASGCLEEYLCRTAESCVSGSLVADYFAFHSANRDILRELGRHFAQRKFQSAVYERDKPSSLVGRKESMEWKRLLEQEFLLPMDVLEGELLRLRFAVTEHVAECLSSGNGEDLNRNLGDERLNEELKERVDFGSYLEAICDGVVSSKVHQIQSEIITAFPGKAYPVEDKLNLFPKVITESDFRSFANDRKEMLAHQIVQLVRASTKQLFFPDRYKNTEHFLSLLSCPGSRFIYQSAADKLTGFELVLLGELPEQFQEIQSNYVGRYGKVGIFRLICIHPESRGKGLYQLLDERALMESIGHVNVNIGRVLFTPVANPAGIAHLKNGHIPQSEIYRDDDQSGWIPFTSSCNRFLRREDDQNGILKIVEQNASELFHDWQKMTEVDRESNTALGFSFLDVE